MNSNFGGGGRVLLESTVARFACTTKKIKGNLRAAGNSTEI
jgi:hypothetical protein